MLASYNWLKEHVDIKDDVYTLAKKLTLIGLEVSHIDHIFKPVEGCVIGKITSISSHPNADKLRLTQVDIGSEVLDIVCGANNIEVGIKVPVATIGCLLPNGLKIKPAKIRGESSSGMILSKEELGIEKSSEGIWVLSDEAQTGTSIHSFLPKEDFILDFDITSNRPDCLSISGLAREIASLNGSYQSKKKHNSFVNKTGNIDIELKEPKRCDRYCARLIKGVNISPSPSWMMERLEAHGIRSINNVVDTTNYVLLEYGHPLHAFSLEKVKDKKIIIRKAQNDESFLSLDDRELKLTPEDLVIADSEKPIALAGVIGGKDSGVHEDTVDILLECAHFDPQAIRSTSKRHKIQTDSSIRFSRYVNIATITDAINYATELIVNMAGGTVASRLTDVYPTKRKAKEINFKYSSIEDRLGVKIEKAQVNKIFQNLGFELQHISDEKIKVTVPLFRSDLIHEWDLIEEVARMYGYDNIPEVLPSIANSSPGIHTDQRSTLRSKLQGLGYNQVVNLSFVENKFIENNGLSLDELVKISNPVTVDIAYLRPNHLFNLLSNVKINIEQHILENQKVFELGHVFSIKDDSYVEENTLGVLGYGFVNTPNWSTPKENYSYYHLAQDIREIFDPLDRRAIEYKKKSIPWFSPNASAAVLYEGNDVGVIGQVDFKLIEKMGLKYQDIFYAEIHCDRIKELIEKSEANNKRVFKPFSLYPSVYRDFAIIASLDLDTYEVMKAIKKFNPQIRKVNLTDIYSGEKIANDKMSVVFNIEYQSFEGTLDRQSVDKIEKNLAEHIVKMFPVNLR